MNEKKVLIIDNRGYIHTYIIIEECSELRYPAVLIHGFFRSRTDIMEFLVIALNDFRAATAKLSKRSKTSTRLNNRSPHLGFTVPLLLETVSISI